MNLLEKYKNMPRPVKASLWFVISSTLQKGIAFLTTPIFTRLMTTSQFGQVTLYNSWLEVFTIFATLNLFYGVYNVSLTKNYDDKEIMTSSMQGLCTTITLGVVLIYLIFHNFINQLTGMSTLITLLLFAEVLFVPAFRFWSALQRYQYKYRTLVFLSLLISAVSPLLGVPAVLVATEKGIARIVTSVSVQILVSCILYVIIFKNGKQFYNKKYWKYAISFNLPLIPHYLSATILNQSDRVMISIMSGTDKAGIYGLAYTIGSLMIIINEAILNSFSPYIYQKLKNENYDTIKKNTTPLLILIVLFSSCLCIVAPELIAIIGGGAYQEGVWIIAPIATSVYFRFLYSLYSYIEFYYEENKFIMIASMCAASLNVALNYIFIKKFGYLAAGYTTLLCYIIYAYAHYLFSCKVLRKHTNINEIYDNKMIFLFAVACILVSLGSMSLYEFTVIRYAVIIFIIIISFLFRGKIISIIGEIRRR